MKTRLPKEIIVTIEEQGSEDEYFSVSKSVDEAAEHGVQKRAGVYVLKETFIIEGIAKIRK